MAELAVASDLGWGCKARAVVLQIAIIVFAVSISFGLRGLVEHYAEQKQVRSFLLGLKADLTRDVMELNELTQHYKSFDTNYQYLAGLDPKAAPDSKFDSAYALTSHNALFIPLAGRFEGFKSSGKLGNIEDQDLQNDILLLYETNHRVLALSDGGWSGSHASLRRYLDDALADGDALSQRYRALTTPNAKRLLRNMATQAQLYERYRKTIALSTRIIQRIDARYAE